MATPLETQPQYAIHGVVVDRASQRGVRGARVEAWDRDTRYHDLLGQVITDDEGAFTIGYDSVYFGDFAPDRSPDVYFKVFLDAREVLNTFDRAMMNLAPGTLQVKLEIDLPALQPARSDRVGVETTMKAVAWWRASDFNGVAREGRDKMSSVGQFMGTLLARRLVAWDFEPVRPAATRENQIVGQNIQQAQSALAQAQVQVTEVRPVSAAGGRADLQALSAYPLTLKAGDRVTLYEEGGTVRYYTRTPATDAAGVDAQAVARLDGEVQTLKAQLVQFDGLRNEVQNLKSADANVDQRLSVEADTSRTQTEELQRLKTELVEVRQAGADKDAQIAQLRTELAAVRTDADNLARRIPLDRLIALEDRINRLDTQVVAPNRAPANASPPSDANAGGEADASHRNGN